MKNRNNNEDSPKTNWVPEPGHRFPVTRRELLAQGFIGFSGMLALPSLVGLSFKSAYAADCGAQTGTPVKLPFMAFDMAGGASFPGNFLVGKEGDPENYLGSYNILGWDPKETGALNKDFGLPMSAKYSKLLEGFLAGCTSADARKNFQMGSFLHGAQDDSTTNKMNAGTLVLRSSQPGLFIGTGLCLRKSASGGNSEPLINDLALKPTYIEDLLDLSSATKFGGAPYSSLSAKQLKALADGSLRLGTIQASALSAYPEGSILQDLSKCAYKKSLEFLNGITGLDPRNDTSVAPVYGLNANTNTRDANALSAAVAMNSIKGTAGPGVWTLGDCDYHTGSQTKGDQRDREMGVEIGRAVEIAFRLKRPFFFQLLTDGGNNASPGTRNWAGDSGDKCMTVVGFYNPKEKPKMIRKQVGRYTEGQGADRSTLTGNSPSLVAYAVFANYLNCCGMLGSFPEFAPGVFTGAGELKSVLLFEETKL